MHCTQLVWRNMKGNLVCFGRPYLAWSESHWALVTCEVKLKKTSRFLNIQLHTIGMCYSWSIISDFTNDLSIFCSVHAMKKQSCIKIKKWRIQRNIDEVFIIKRPLSECMIFELKYHMRLNGRFIILICNRVKWVIFRTEILVSFGNLETK